ncbi:heterokaryon incompatibility protein-domain-containing protein [Paraphoma chrysanthemicola]|uniref:Heterokaryon incompatibility protein-domain-containing protein n=1 Tax=Paraphoma chrysanthemicola TaxID=798071 RepID=A0A8K0R3W5_9PLEO|nr:heterokaryon incompatibility protein-domain-containing protein [Paraphoma chrysanthemicola]
MIRLLTWNQTYQLRLVKFDNTERTPPYAILSHTWNQDEEQEVTYDDVVAGNATSKSSYEKVEFCIGQAERDGIAYIWIDTCCIERRNGPEIAEAINSMFRWYQKAENCYVYLTDVSIPADGNEALLSSMAWVSVFQDSRWFRRGWTLQELLAPHTVRFYDRDGHFLGDKSSLEEPLHRTTRLPRRALHGDSLSGFSVAERMSWTRGRETRKEEDQIYCLLGIFDVSMPLIYGEGLLNAARRLREEILKNVCIQQDRLM